MRTRYRNQLSIVALAALLAGCGTSDPASTRSKDDTGAVSPVAKILAENTKLTEDEAQDLTETADDAIRPKNAPDGWERTGPGAWTGPVPDGEALSVNVSSYTLPTGSPLTPKSLLEVTKDQLTKFSPDPPKYGKESVGTFLRRPGTARLEYDSLSPKYQRPLSHVQYIARIGTRVYNVIAVGDTAQWPARMPEAERFIATLDLNRPEPTERAIKPFDAGAERDIARLTPGASGREVQDAIATWSYERPDSKFPWFPKTARCESPEEMTARTWTCIVEFVTPKGTTDPLEVGVELAATGGTWTADVDDQAAIDEQED